MPLTPSESDYKAPLLDVDEPVPPVISEGAPSPDAASETAEKLGTLCDLAESGIAPQEASVESRVDHLSRNPGMDFAFRFWVFGLCFQFFHID